MDEVKFVENERATLTTSTASSANQQHSAIHSIVEAPSSKFHNIPQQSSVQQTNQNTVTSNNHAVYNNINNNNVQTSNPIVSVSQRFSGGNSNNTDRTNDKKSEEFVIFGSYVAEVMKNMDKHKARMLQMKVIELITEFDDGN